MNKALRVSGWRNVLRHVPAGSVLYYPCLPEGFDYDTVKDFSGLANHGTRIGATWQRFSSGLPNLRYDGDDYVNIDVAVNDLAATTKGTWMTWVKLDDATPAASSIAISVGDTDADSYLSLYIKTTGVLSFTARLGGISKWGIDTDAAAVSDGVPAHVAVIQDGANPVLVLNGVQVAQTFNAVADKTIWFSQEPGIDNGRIGCFNKNSGGNAAFLTNGNTALTKLINTNLTVAQVLGIYKMQQPFVGV